MAPSTRSRRGCARTATLQFSTGMLCAGWSERLTSSQVSGVDGCARRPAVRASTPPSVLFGVAWRRAAAWRVHFYSVERLPESVLTREVRRNIKRRGAQFLRQVRVARGVQVLVLRLSTTLAKHNFGNFFSEIIVGREAAGRCCFVMERRGNFRRKWRAAAKIPNRDFRV